MGGYLLDEVGPRFHTTGKIEPVDLFLIFSWKANRAKTKMRDKLKKLAKGNFNKATASIAAALSSAKDDKERLAILMRNWKFRLPMASAVLTVLYPDEFTIYDILVCKELKLKYRPQMHFSEKCWTEYQHFKDLVCEKTPAHLTLREKDRYLRGQINSEEGGAGRNRITLLPLASIHGGDYDLVDQSRSCRQNARNVPLTERSTLLLGFPISSVMVRHADS